MQTAQTQPSYENTLRTPRLGTHLSSEELLERCREGDKLALQMLMQRYEGLIYGLAYKLTGNYDDANDVAAETYVRLCSMLATCRSAVALPAWISRVVSNIFCDTRRRAQRCPAVSLDGLMEAAGDAPLAAVESSANTPLQHVEAEERKRILSRAVSTLPGHQREIIKLFYQDERSHEEISSMMGIAVGTVKSRLNRAREALQQKLSVHQNVLMN